MLLTIAPSLAMRVLPFSDRDFHFLYMADVASYDDLWELRDYDTPQRIVLVSWEHKPVGFVAWRVINKGNEEGCYAVIDKLCVLPRYRFKGHGSYLLAKCLNDTRRYRKVALNATLEAADWLSKRTFLAEGPMREDEYGYSWLTWQYHHLP